MLITLNIDTVSRPVVDVDLQTKKGDVFDKKLTLTYMYDKKERVFVFSKDCCVIGWLFFLYRDYSSIIFTCFVGRSSTNHLRLKDRKVSRNHAKIEMTRDKHAILCDMGSSRGTQVYRLCLETSDA